MPGVGFRISGIAFRGSGFIGWGVGLGFRERGERWRGGEEEKERGKEVEKERGGKGDRVGSLGVRAGCCRVLGVVYGLGERDVGFRERRGGKGEREGGRKGLGFKGRRGREAEGLGFRERKEQRERVPLGPLGFEGAQHRQTLSPSVDGIRSKALRPFGLQ